MGLSRRTGGRATLRGRDLRIGSESDKKLQCYPGVVPDVGLATSISYLGRIGRGQEGDTAFQKVLVHPKGHHERSW